ncbi:alcohol dehydrogenase catalytic domain-containing protein [Paenibacillus sonchi]|uniref:Alcohol dehydrogenase catalytic domain-containing protein n=1 Tax=Paenibacillus sonchi TaxID=373687 RepID=A0A974PDC4_9BACL|nr:zinc-binding dehydrogenase [Paenibacillus sonchi]QQZ61192.1 alcohol dehydrogenase catalytic domain-containing protein [Paenibacillus sonchi]
MKEYAIPATGKIAVLTGNREITIKELPIPEINDEEILVRVDGCGICGTDVHEYKGDPFGYIPVHLGHEGTGTIVKLGKNVTRDYSGKPLAIGDKIVTGLKPCGKCDICLNHPEQIHLCGNGEIFGLLPGEAHYFNGWFGDYMKVNAGGVVFNVSDMDTDLRILIEPAAVVVHAVEKAKEIFNFKHDSYVLIQGCGPIGLLLLGLVRTMGVRNIIALDADQKRLDLAKQLGAAEVVNISQTADPVAAVKAVAGGLGAEMAFQVTGSPKAASMIWNYVRRGGSLCELGFFVNNGETSYNPHLDICNKEIKVIGSWTYASKDWLQACEFLKECTLRGIPITSIISHRYSIDNLTEAFEKNISMEGCKIIYQSEH